METAGFGDLLSGLPGTSVEPAALVGAEVVRPDETDVERHLEALWELLEGAGSARGVAPVVSPGYVERFRADAVRCTPGSGAGAGTGTDS